MTKDFTTTEFWDILVIICGDGMWLLEMYDVLIYSRPRGQFLSAYMDKNTLID